MLRADEVATSLPSRSFPCGSREPLVKIEPGSEQDGHKKLTCGLTLYGSQIIFILEECLCDGHIIQHDYDCMCEVRIISAHFLVFD